MNFKLFSWIYGYFVRVFLRIGNRNRPSWKGLKTAPASGLVYRLASVPAKIIMVRRIVLLKILSQMVRGMSS